MTLKSWLNEAPGAAAIEREEATRLQTGAAVTPFDPRTEVSADAKYIVRLLVIWFLIVPTVLGAVLWIASH